MYGEKASTWPPASSGSSSPNSRPGSPGVAAEQVDTELERALRQLVECLGTDRASFAEFSPDGTNLRPTHSWARSSIEPHTSAFLREDAPWLHGRLLQGATIRIERLPDDLPEDSGREREYVRRTGINSILVLPIAVRGRFVCALATSAFQTPRAWSNLTVARV
jgi:formate hydrogenlyase transcriptional activator